MPGFSYVDWIGWPINRRSTTCYCIFVGKNILFRKSKKQSMVLWSSIESEYHAMAYLICDLVWVKYIGTWFHFEISYEEYCDNQVSIHIAKNLVFHERTEHIEVDCYLVHQKVAENKIIQTRHVSSTHQLGDILRSLLERLELILYIWTSWHVRYICSSLRGSVIRSHYVIKSHYY